MNSMLFSFDPEVRRVRSTTPTSPASPWLAVLLAFTAITLSGLEASAATAYKARVDVLDIGGSFNRNTNDVADLPLFASGGAGATAFVGVSVNGSLGGFASATPGDSTARASGNIQRFGELIFSGPSPTVFTRLNVQLDGELVVEDPDPTKAGFSEASIAIGQSMRNNNTSQTFGFPNGNGQLVIDTELFPGSGGIHAPALGYRIVRRTGFLAGVSPAEASNFDEVIFRTGQFQVETGVPYTFNQSLTVFAEAYTPGHSARSSFENTFGFPTNGPIFDLPEGFTVNSSDLNIVNNTLVPAPAALILMLSALSCLTGLAYSRTRTP